MSTEKILKGMVALNLELEKSDLTPTEKWEQSINNTHFIAQQPKLGMFIPTDEDENVLEEPIYSEYVPAYLNDNFNKRNKQEDYEMYLDQYQQALSEVIFDGWELEHKSDFTTFLINDNYSLCFTDRGKINLNGIEIKTIEDLVPFNLKMK